jgi:predicted RNA-binding protein YlxR (DUF448 family)
MCIVTREVMPTDALIRFVVAPDGAVVADLRHRLPGRGVWVTAKAEHVRTAERKKLFARGFGEPVRVEPGLDRRVADQLAAAAVQSLSMARKAGSAVAGFAKVEAAIAREPVVALIHAAEAARDGTAKLDAAFRRRVGQMSDFCVVRTFTGEQLDLAFGRPNVIHAALLAGPASANVLRCAKALADFLGEAERVDDTDNHLTLPGELSAGP